MEYKELLLDNKKIGYYIEVDMNKYDLQLVSRKMYSNESKTVVDYVNLNEKAVGGINGCLFTKKLNGINLVPDKLIGVQKDIKNNIDGESDTYGPNIAWISQKLTQVWGKVNDTNCNWFLSPAYYWFLRDGNYVSGDVMPGYENYINNSDTRSMIGQKIDGTIVLAATDTRVTGEDQANALKNIGCINAANLDGGGSRQLILKNGSGNTVNTNILVPNAILVVTKDTDPVDPTPEAICKMKLFGSAARLRDNVVDGNIKTTIPNGTEFEVIGLYSWKASDNYRWGYGKWNGYEGYFQYDSAVMMPLGSNLNTLNFKMRLFNSAARIRTKPVNGEILTTVPNGNDITIIQFGKIIESDGYQWFQGSFNGITGFLQYDPAVMFPTND